VSEERSGLELQRIREERGLTVGELAEKSGISATTIRGVEREVWELQRRRT
jgi:transcriptional regulator with XRE-family HTH domain